MNKYVELVKSEGEVLVKSFTRLVRSSGDKSVPNRSSLNRCTYATARCTSCGTLLTRRLSVPGNINCAGVLVLRLVLPR